LIGSLSANGSPGVYNNVMEQMFENAYTTNPNIWNFSINFLPPDYADGFMLTSWR